MNSPVPIFCAFSRSAEPFDRTRAPLWFGQDKNVPPAAVRNSTADVHFMQPKGLQLRQFANYRHRLERPSSFSKGPNPPMRPRLLALLVLLSALTAFGQDGALTDIRPKPATYGLDREQEPVRGRCVAVIDGDTIRVLTAGQQLLRVRLAFIDAPERRQAFGTLAKLAMSDLVFGHEVTLYPHAIDRHGRTVAIVYADDKDIGLEMLKAGLAWPYYRYLLQAPASVQESYRQAADQGLNDGRISSDWQCSGEFFRPAL
jgi:endonuclease YncB( thermonuclease family)